MKASYRKGVIWIAMNDEPLEFDKAIVSEMISVQLLAELFNKDTIQVAHDVISYRIKGY